MSKPEIVICLYAYYPFANSNTNVMLSLIKKLAERYQINIVTQNNDNSALNYEVCDGINIYRYKRQNKLIRFLHTLETMDEKKDRGWYRNVIISIVHPISVWLHNFKFFKHTEYKLIKQLMTQKHFSFILSTCESFSSHLNVLRLKKEIGFTVPWIAYFMDPYAYFVGNLGGSGKLVKQECEIYEKSDLILVTEEIFNDNKSNAFEPYLYKTRPVRFGNFRLVHSELVNPVFIKGRINCVYVGSLLNENIRNPRYLYKIINLLDDKYVFHIICNNFSEENRRLRDTVLKQNNKVRWYYNLPLSECLGIMSNADILINLGNKATNQTPSKIFDYIGTGRPIVNFYSLENDTSKKYLELYPNKINIYEDENKLDENRRLFESFAVDNKSHIIHTEILSSLYHDYLSEIVTENTMNTIDEYIKNRCHIK